MSASLKTRLPLIAASLRPRIASVVKDSAERIAEGAAENLSYGPDPHHIKDEIHVERMGPAEYAVVAGNDDTFYGHILENGGKYIPARPFLVPATEAERPLAEAQATGVLRGL